MILLSAQLLLVCGCIDLSFDDMVPPVLKPFADELEKCWGVADLATTYYESRDRWPESLAEIQDFCIQEDANCADANWGDLEQADFHALPDDGVQMDIVLAEGKGRLVLDVHGPIDVNEALTGPVQMRFESPGLIYQVASYEAWEGKSLAFVDKDNRVIVMVDGEDITSYRYGDELSKPILWPVKSPSGIVLTRGFPFAKVKGESTDHPHHTGVFFTYDNVNGQGFWNNTTSPPQIKQIGSVKMETKPGKGILETVSHWTAKSGKVLLEEKRKMEFVPGEEQYTIDFTIELIAQNEKVVFGDTKEGMFAIRLADWLKEDGGTGEYLSSNGDRREKNVWGRRASWVRLQGQQDGRVIGIAIFNHPDSVNYPTYWHARGYGLFSANPLGQFDFQKGRGVENPEHLNFTLESGQSALFRFRIVIYDGARTTEQLEKQFKEFVK